MKSPSASKIELACCCLAPWASLTTWPKSPMGDAAKLGTAWHEVAAEQIRRGIGHSLELAVYDKALTKVELNKPSWAHQLENRKPSLAARELLHTLPDATAEIGWTLNLLTDKAICVGPVKSHFELPPLSPPNVGGIADVHSFSIDPVTGDTILTIIDWKTGIGELPPPGESMQLITLAYAAWLCNPTDLVVVQYRVIDAAGNVDVRATQFTALELGEAVRPAKEMMIRLMAGGTACDPMPGEHCRSKWCPVKGICPAITSALAVAAPDPVDKVPQSVADIFGPVDAAAWLDKLQRVLVVAEHIETVLREYSRTVARIPCGSGSWGPTDCSRENIRGENLLDVAMTLGIDPDEMLTLLPGGISKTDIKALAKVLAPPRGQTKWEKDAIASLRAAGMIVETTFVKYEVRK